MNQDIVARYRAGQSMEEIGKALGLDRRTVGDRLRAAGEPRRANGPIPRRSWSPEAIDAQFFSCVEKTATCWLWTKSVGKSGYALFRGASGIVYAHRWSYERWVGPIPDGLHIDHLCRNPRCVRPDHLEPVTCRENLMRGEGFSARNFKKDRCSHGHPYTPENTITRLAGNGRLWRTCRICKRHRERSRLARHG